MWDRRYLLQVVEEDAGPAEPAKPGTLVIRVGPDPSERKTQEIVAAWCRQQVREAAAALVAKWEPILGVEARLRTFSV